MDDTMVVTSLVKKNEIELLGDVSMPSLYTSGFSSSSNEISVNSVIIANNADITRCLTPVPEPEPEPPVKETVYTSSGLSSEEYYYKVIKRQNPDLENSYGELFRDNVVRGPDFAREYVAKRFAKALDKVKKSLSCANLQSLNNNTYVHTNEDPSTLNNILNKSFRRSFDCLNETVTINHQNSFCKDQPKDSTFKIDACPNQRKLRKSSSFNGFSGLIKDEFLDDVEPVFEESLPSENEKDEMGLPVKKIFFPCTPPKKQPDLSVTLKKYKKILRSSFGEPSQVGSNDDIMDSDKNNGACVGASEPPLLPDAPDVDIHLKKTQSKTTTSSGPMKAFVPLQNMAKQIGVKIMSPFKKKNEMKTDVFAKNSSQVLGESFDGPPMAASTPTDNSRSSRRENTSFTLKRSVSEGRTPVKSSVDHTSHPIQIKASDGLEQSSQAKATRSASIKAPPAIHRTSIKTPLITKSISSSNIELKVGLQQTSQATATCRTSIKAPPAIRRTSIKAPLTTKSINSSNIEVKVPVTIRQSISKLSKASKPSAPQPATTSNKKIENTTITLKKPSTITKLRRPTTHHGKENK